MSVPQQTKYKVNKYIVYEVSSMNLVTMIIGGNILPVTDEMGELGK